MCHVSRVTCRVSCVTCHLSRVTCHLGPGSKTGSKLRYICISPQVYFFNVLIRPNITKCGASSRKFTYVRNKQEVEVLNLKGHQNHIIGSKVTAILLEKKWILPCI